MPWMMVKDGNKTCVHKKNADGSAGESLHCYDGEDQEAKAKEYMKALYANAGHENMQQNFLFAELSDQDLVIKYMDGMAAGTFTAMNGDEVTFKPKELQTYIDNTMAIIESTRTESGEIVGLPIDKDKHDHGGGAGWIIGLELDQARNVIRFIVNWTKDGVELIKGNIRRFFSPSIDPEEKIILGGSLTNWPATRGEKGKMLLRPIELSKQIKEIDMPKTLEEMQAGFEALQTTVAELTAKLTPKPPAAPEDDDKKVADHLTEFMNDEPSSIEELSRQANAQAQLVIKAEKRRNHVKEFASRLVGGTEAKPFGIRYPATKIIRLLLSLPEKQAAEVEELIGAVYQNAVDFAEHGIDGTNYQMKPKLPAEFQEAARVWVDGKKPIKEWFEAMGADAPGKYEDFNLADFEPAKED